MVNRSFLFGGEIMEKRVDGPRKIRLFIVGVIIIFAVSFFIPSPSTSASKDPIKIGILYPMTGGYALLGKRQLRGWELVFEAVDYKVAGRPVEFIVEDTKGEPNVGVTKVTKLIEKDRVHILGGVVSSAVGYAIRDIVDRSEVPLVITMANAGGLTRDKRSPFIFRTFQPGGAPSYHVARFIYEDLKLRRALFSGNDMAYGREHAEMFKKEFERLGGKVVFENFAPLFSADYGPYVAELGQYADKADVLHFVYSGADAIRFVKTAGDFGLHKKFVLTNWGATPDGSTLLPMGPAVEGIYNANIHFYGLKTKENQRFLELNKRKGGGLDSLDFYGYLGADVVLHALEKIEGNVEAKGDFLKALRTVRFQCPTGPFKFDPRSQNALINLFIGQTKKVDGELIKELGKYQNTLIKTIPEAQDPWWIGR
jgi:branched-chain amino acid transport system substrate-binding protein